MLDIKFIREHKELIRDAAKKKGITFDIDLLIAADDQRLTILAEVESLRAKQNRVSREIAETTDGSRDALIVEMRVHKEAQKDREQELRETMQKWHALMVQVPNIPDISVPDGASDADNVEVRTVGEKPTFSCTPKNHIELMEQLDMVDFERGAKVAGFRGYFLKGPAVALSMALWQAAHHYMQKKGFTPLMVPALVTKPIFLGTGYLPQGEEDLYKTQDDTYLSGTAEVPTMGYYMDETLSHTDLPKRIASFSPCYRREAGSHGKDTRGLFRVHEFYKWEEVILCEASHEASVRHHEELLANAEELMQALGLHYRVVLNCGGDLGLGQVKKYDIEVWMPGAGAYRETHSVSYFHDFQARRLNIRYRDTDDKLRFVHSLNSTVLPTPRLLIALIEQFQNEDGSITIPPLLQPLIGATRIPADGNGTI